MEQESFEQRQLRVNKNFWKTLRQRTDKIENILIKLIQSTDQAQNKLFEQDDILNARHEQLETYTRGLEKRITIIERLIRRPLSAKQKEVLELWREGLSQKQMSERLGISQTSVSNRLKIARTKGHPYKAI